MNSEQSLMAAHVVAAGSAAAAATVGVGQNRVYDGKIAGLYDLEETLGSGHFAVVKLAKHVFTGAKVAVKVVDKTKLDEVSKAHLFQEVRCMKLVQHPNVVRLYEVIDTATKLYLVLELGDGGDLYDYIMKHEGGLSEELARKYFRQILRAISYCHQLHVVHRDLKPENVVFFEKLGVVKLTDFGFSNKFSPGQKLETFCGSLAYSAPEILLGDSYDAPAVDIWSLGVILYMLVCGQPPFEKANDSETLTMIMDCKYSVPPQITKPCQQLIASMLVRDPKKRATLEQIAHDPWLQVADECDGVADFLPLVSREEISEEDHNFILQKMINGNIASKESIMQSLDKNQYNHITATYFLLAELRLRKRREELNKKQQLADTNNPALFRKMGDVGKNMSGNNAKTVVGTLRIPNIVCLPAAFENDVVADKRTRKCSIVREEEEDETGYDSAVKGNELKVAITRRESISDGRLNQSVQEHALTPCRPTTALPVPSTCTKSLTADNTLAHKLVHISRHSVALVDDKCTTEEDKFLVNSGMQGAIKGLKELKLLQAVAASNSNKNSVLTHRRMKLNKIRTPSCSSSEASDDDTKTRNKKKLNKLVGDTPVRFQMHRRDSHDDSSDSQDQAFPSSSSTAAHLLAAKTAGGNSSGENGKKDKDKDNNSNGKTQKGKKQSKDNNADKSLQQTQKLQTYTTTSSHGRRRRIRESQSLDRINEELELRHRYFPMEAHAEHKQQQQQQQTQSFIGSALIETKAEYEDEFKQQQQQQQHHIQNTATLQTLEATETLLQLKLGKSKFYTLNSIDEVDLLLKQQQKQLNKAFQQQQQLQQKQNNTTTTTTTTGTNCIVSIKRIRRLGKYFPVVNFS